MAVDFTVVSAVRQRFGDQKQDKNTSESEREAGWIGETQAPFVGSEKSFTFQCPNVDRTRWAVLLFESFGVTRRQTMQINNQPVFGGIPEDVEENTRIFGTGSDEHPVSFLTARWNGSVKLIHPGVLQASNNVLRISTTEAYVGTGNLDDFIIDNVVVIFKTAGQGGPLGTAGTIATARKKAAPKKRAAKKAAKRR